MLEAIDVIYIDNNMRISQTTTLKPWKIFIPSSDNTKYILELRENSISRKNIKINTEIKIVKSNEK